MTYKIRTCETPLKNAMESGKVIAEGHVQLPAIAPGETGKARFTLPASFREGDVLELEAFDKEGKVSVTGPILSGWPNNTLTIKWHRLR